MLSFAEAPFRSIDRITSSHSRLTGRLRLQGFRLALCEGTLGGGWGVQRSTLGIRGSRGIEGFGGTLGIPSPLSES